jgi:hypothetical protein
VDSARTAVNNDFLGNKDPDRGFIFIIIAEDQSGVDKQIK